MKIDFLCHRFKHGPSYEGCNTQVTFGSIVPAPESCISRNSTAETAEALWKVLTCIPSLMELQPLSPLHCTPWQGKSRKKIPFLKLLLQSNENPDFIDGCPGLKPYADEFPLSYVLSLSYHHYFQEKEVF